MNANVTLDEKHLQTAAQQATKAGKSVDDYIASLIDLHAKTFDEIAAPISKDFESMPDDELYALIEKANKAARKQLRSSR